MIRLKEIRSSLKLTQLEVASRLRVSAQTYARWENGKTEPSLAALRDVSSVFGTSVDNLLGRAADESPSNDFRLVSDHEGEFWGHAGFRLPGAVHTAWYPVTDGQASRLRDRLSGDAHKNEWFAVQTLNNRVIAFRPKQLQQVWLLDDASSAPKDDFVSATPLDDELISRDAYNAMAEWVDSKLERNDKFRTNYTRDHQRTTIELVTRLGFSEKPVELGHVLRQTVIHFNDGRVLRFEADAGKISDLLLYLESGAKLEMAEIPHRDCELEGFYSLDMLRLIDLPLIELEAAWGAEGE